MRVPAMGLLWTAILVVSIVAIPVAAKVGLLILKTSPNLRHPPADIMGEAVGWAVIGAVVGGAGAMIGDAMVMRDRRGTYRAYKGILVGSLVAVFAAGAFGAGLMLLGVSMEFTELSMMVRALVILLFILLTSPVAAHAIGHAGYVTGARLWEGTLKDDLKRQGARQEAAVADARPARPGSEGEPPAT